MVQVTEDWFVLVQRVLSIITHDGVRSVDKTTESVAIIFFYPVHPTTVQVVMNRVTKVYVKQTGN